MDLRYPIGHFKPKEPLTSAERQTFIGQIEQAPDALRSAVEGLTPEQLDTPYRPDGWTVRQVVHHIPDSHLNAYIRFRLALTEDLPTIKPYDEAKWAELPDARTAETGISLDLLEALHRRWVLLLRSMSDRECTRRLNHPEQGIVTLDRFIGLYAWHGRHHIAHITSLRERNGW
ncbi:MAG: bacillithiol transferase BstA [Balneolaceae bacterium]